MDRWIGKVAVVTGASSGIGEAIAKSLAINGMIVVGLARREDRLIGLAKELEDAQGSFEFVCCDVRNEEDIVKAFEIIEEKFGGVDVLVNNAGIGKNDTLSEVRTDTLRTVLEVNLLGVALCTREAVKSMRKQKNEAHIFNMNSVLGVNVPVTSKDVNIYPASKFGLRAMTDCLRDEFILTKDNIKVTSIHPGLVKTEIARHSGHGDEVFDFLAHLKSEEIADCIIFALSRPPKTQVCQIVISPLHEKL